MDFKEFSKLFEAKARVSKKKYAPLLEGLDGYRASVAAVLMENEHSELNKFKGTLLESPTNVASQFGTPASGGWESNTTGFEVVALPMIRRLIPSLNAFDLFAVQPMTQPVGIAFAMRFYLTQYDNASKSWVRGNDGVITPTGSQADVEAGTNNQDLLSKAGTETIFNYNFHNVSGGAGMGNLFDSQTGTAKLNTAAGEVAVPSRIKMEIVKDSISPISRKLAADWTYESMQDMEAVHGIDLQAELVGETAREISTEIDRELIANSIFSASAHHSSFTYMDTQATPVEQKAGATIFKQGGGDIIWDDLDGRWFAERMLGLKTRIEEMATQMGISNRRGRATWMICSHQLANAFTVLEEKGFYKKADDVNIVGGIGKVGKLGDLDVYSDPLFEQLMNYVMPLKTDIDFGTVKNDKGYWFILGYKGPTVLDTGIVYMPYVPMMLTGMVYDPMTFQPSVGMMTRYGLAGNMFGTENYYSIGRVSAITENLPF